MLQLHTTSAWVLVLSNALVGLWSLGAYWLEPLRHRSMWWFVIIAELSVFWQVGIGTYVFAVEGIEAPEFHLFYGFLTIVTVAILFAYREQARAYLYLLYGFGSLFLMGLGIRAMFLA